MPAKPVVGYGPSGEQVNYNANTAPVAAAIPLKGFIGQASTGSVVFPVAFTQTPNVNCNAINGATPNFIVITSATTTGFSYTVYAYSGGTTSGAITWGAQGY